MTQQQVIIGAVDAKQGDTLFSAFTKLNSNATDAETRLALLEGASTDLVVDVCEDADWPRPGGPGTQIVLSVNTEYRLCASHTITNNIKPTTGSLVTGTTPFGPRLTYNGSSPMFQSTDSPKWTCKDLEVDCPNAIMVQQTGGVCVASSIVIKNCVEVADLTGASLQITESTAEVVTGTKAIAMSGSNLALVLRQSQLLSSATNHDSIDVRGATFFFFKVDDIDTDAGTGGFGLIGDSGGVNMISGRFGLVTGSTFGLGGGQGAISGIDEVDEEFIFSANGNIKDTAEEAFSTMRANATNTVIPGVGGFANATLIAGTWVAQSVAHFTATAAGRHTSTAKKPIEVSIIVEAFAQPVSGSNKKLYLYIAINGAPIQDSEFPVVASSSASEQVSTFWEAELVETDYVEAFITSNDGTDVLVEYAKILTKV
jgi:hypothetical protein